MSSLLTFSRFFSIEEAKPLTELLEKEHIVFLIEQEVNQLDPIYIGNNMDPMIVVKIPQESFRRVNDLLESRAAIEIQRADPQHYLYSFTNSELLNVLNNPEEWSLYDTALTRKILKEKNIIVPPPADNLYGNEGYKPEHLKKSWIVLGYTLSLFFAFGGIFISLVLLNSTKVLKSGRKIKMYDHYTRNHGKNIFIIGLIMVLIYFIVILQ